MFNNIMGSHNFFLYKFDPKILEGKFDFRRILNLNVQTGSGILFPSTDPDPTKIRNSDVYPPVIVLRTPSSSLLYYA